MTLHQNRWHCDCHLLALHNWLQNFTVPNSVEPRCHSPPRLISEPIKNLSPQEFACIPKVSPTSMYLEVIEGKNMSLVCSIEVRSKLNNLEQKYRRLRCLLRVKGLLICLYLGWSGSIFQFRQNIINVGSKSWLLTCSINIVLSLPLF